MWNFVEDAGWQERLHIAKGIFPEAFTVFVRLDGASDVKVPSPVYWRHVHWHACGCCCIPRQHQSVHKLCALSIDAKCMPRATLSSKRFLRRSLGIRPDTFMGFRTNGAQPCLITKAFRFERLGSEPPPFCRHMSPFPTVYAQVFKARRDAPSVLFSSCAKLD